MEAKIRKIFVSFFVREIPAEFLPKGCLRGHYFSKNRRQSFSLEQIGSASALMPCTGSA